MKIGIWNIDCPSNDQPRFGEIKNIIESQNCDLIILTEVNSFLKLNGYQSHFSDESPYMNRSRNYQNPNKYHQVGIYSKKELIHNTVNEPINTLLCEIEYQNKLIKILGSVFTIKDRWANWSNLKYSDRASQQIDEIKNISESSFIIGGDFNFKYRSNFNKIGYNKIIDLMEDIDMIWPTKYEENTVQQILHSKDMKSEYQIININRIISDHPFVIMDITFK